MILKINRLAEVSFLAKQEDLAKQRALACLLGIMLALVPAVVIVPKAAGARPASVYTLAKVRLDVRADNAVLAKKQAMKEGPLQALKLIFKRFAPFRAYDRLATMTPKEADDVLDGFAVRSERYSSTRYLALLDYNFSKTRLQAFMVKKGVPFFDQRSRKLAIMPVFTLSGDEQADRQNKKNWLKAWRIVDLKHALTNSRLFKAKSSDQQSWQKIATGELTQFAQMRRRHSTNKLLLLDAHPNAEQNRLILRIFGKDYMGPVDYTQEMPIENGLRKSFEKAAELAFGIIEGRWREPQITGELVAVSLSSATLGAGLSKEMGRRLVDETFFMRIAFSGLRDWQQIKKRLQRIPGVRKIDVNSLSPRGADVRMSYPGGVDRLETRLSPYGFSIDRDGSNLTLRSILR